MKRLLCLALVLLLLTGCAASAAPEDAFAGSTPEHSGTAADAPESSSPGSISPEASAPESTADNGSTPAAAPESTPTAEEPVAPEPVTLPTDLDTLLRLPAYYWYGYTVKTDDPVSDFGSFVMDAAQKEALYALLQPESWTVAGELPGMGITPVLCAQNSTHTLTLCRWDDAALILLDRKTEDSRQRTQYFAPSEVYDDACRFMDELAYATLPNPQQMKDLSSLCAYPNTLTAEFTAHLTAMEIGTAESLTMGSSHWMDCFHILEPYFYTSLLPLAWESADEIPADALLRFFGVVYFSHYPTGEKFLIDALILEPILQQYYDVSVHHLRTADNFIRDAGCYRFSGIDGPGGTMSSPTLLQRTGENSWRIFTALDVSAPQLQYSAFDFELTDTGFRYLCGLGEVAAEALPLPVV